MGPRPRRLLAISRIVGRPLCSFRRRARFCVLMLVVGAAVAGLRPLRAQTRNRIAGQIDSARSQVLANHHPLWANPAHDAGPVPGDLKLSGMTLVLARTPQQEQAFTQFLAGQQNPASPEFHHWLTAAEIGRRFGLSPTDLDALRGWLESQGLHVTWVAPSSLFWGFSGTAASVSRAFQSELRYYNVNGTRRLSISADPRIPQALAGVIQSVRGLYQVDDRPSHFARPQAAGPDYDNAGGHYLTPQDFATIYNLPSNVSGAGATIGIVGWSRVDSADLEQFREKTGTSFRDPIEVVPTTFGGVDPGPAYTTAQLCGSCLGGQQEATLDVLRAGSVAQDANLLLVVSSPAGSSDGIGADAQYLIQTSPAPAQIVSISFGDCEANEGPSGVSYWNSLFKQAAAEGISVFVSSGDSGAAGCDDSFAAPPSTPGAVSPNYMCSSPYATCVGGTEFNDTVAPQAYWSTANNAALGSARGYIPEGGWNEPLSSGSTPQVAASGGGTSSYIAMPAWQQKVIGAASLTSGRSSPDLAFASSCREGYFGCLAAAGTSCVSGNDGSYRFEILCGTSAGAPSMAGVAALLDEQMAGQAQGNLNPQLYSMEAAASQVYHDVTLASSGVANCDLSMPSTCNNSVPSLPSLTGAQPGYQIGPGFDAVTGLGSLNVQAFLSAYGNSQPPASINSQPGFSIAGTSVALVRGAGNGNVSTITLTPRNGFSGGVVLTAQVTRMPSGTTAVPTFTWSPDNQVQLSGSGASVVTLGIAVTSSAAVAAGGGLTPWRAGEGVATACLLLICIPRRRPWRGYLALTVLMAASLSLTACNASLDSASASAASRTAAGSYTVTVTGTSGAITQTAVITLSVQ